MEIDQLPPAPLVVEPATRWRFLRRALMSWTLRPLLHCPREEITEPEKPELLRLMVMLEATLYSCAEAVPSESVPAASVAAHAREMIDRRRTVTP